LAVFNDKSFVIDEKEHSSENLFLIWNCVMLEIRDPLNTIFGYLAVTKQKGRQK